METTETTHEQDRLAVEQIAASREKIEQELGRVIIGQKAAVEEILVTLFAGANCLITGVPGLAKTMMVRAIAGIFSSDPAVLELFVETRVALACVLLFMLSLIHI